MAIDKKAVKHTTKQPSHIFQMFVNYTARSIANFPIHECLASTSIFEKGLGSIILSRKLPNDDLALAAMLIDPYCFGAKNATFRIVAMAEYLYIMENFRKNEIFEPIHPSCLRKMVEGAMQYAKNLGFSPHSNYTSASLLFGDIDAAACPVHYEYGLNGQPFYVQSPDETDEQALKIMQILRQKTDSVNIKLLPESELIDYQVTYQPLKNDYNNLPSYIKDRIEQFLYSELNGQNASKIQEGVDFLISTIKRYPHIPQLYNYLSNAYFRLGNIEKSRNVTEETLRLFPNYLFGLTKKAEFCLLDKDIDLIPKLFKYKYNLKLLYPKRKVFHASEIIAFHGIMVEYFHSKGNQEQANNHYNIIHEINPDHPITKHTDRIIHSPSPSPSSFNSRVKNLFTKIIGNNEI